MRVLLVDDHQLLLDGLRSLLTAHDVDVVGTARHGLECLAQARLLRPDVILMDVGIPVCDGLTATRLVKAELPEIKVIMLSAAADDQQLFEAVKSGAIGYLLKSMDADELMTALEDALNDVPPLAPSLAHRLLAEFSVPAGRGHAASASMSDGRSAQGPGNSRKSTRCGAVRHHPQARPGRGHPRRRPHRGGQEDRVRGGVRRVRRDGATRGHQRPHCPDHREL